MLARTGAAHPGYKRRPWNIVTGKFPEATQIVDLYHAREHLHSLEFMFG